MTSGYAVNDFQVYGESSRIDMLRFVPVSATRILDVGCSIGNFGALLKSERGAEVWGVEIDKAACEKASERIDRVVCSPFDLNSKNLLGEKFDCIVFNDVLEHMVDPYSALVFSKSLLAEGGSVVASIPNVRYFENVWNLIVKKTWDYTDTGILDRTHLRFFTKKSIKRLFQELDFEILDLQGINPVDSTHPHLRQRFRMLNLVTAKRIEDMRWMQFAVVAKIGN